MRVSWRRRALSDAVGAYAYLEVDSATAAAALRTALRDTADSLSTFPSRGRLGRMPGTRELLVGGTLYILIFEVRPQGVRILRVLHSSRRYPAD